MNPPPKNGWLLGSAIGTFLLFAAIFFFALREIEAPSPRTVLHLFWMSVIATIVVGLFVFILMWRSDLVSKLDDAADALGTRIGLTPSKLSRRIRRFTKSRAFSISIIVLFVVYAVFTTYLGMSLVRGHG